MPKVPEKTKKEDGTIEWRLDGSLHREDGPAVEMLNGTRVWFRHGKQHREDGPAVEYADGTIEWHLKGVSVDESIVQDTKKSAEFMKKLGSSN